MLDGEELLHSICEKYADTIIDRRKAMLGSMLDNIDIKAESLCKTLGVRNLRGAQVGNTVTVARSEELQPEPNTQAPTPVAPEPTPQPVEPPPKVEEPQSKLSKYGWILGPLLGAALAGPLGGLAAGYFMSDTPPEPVDQDNESIEIIIE